MSRLRVESFTKTADLAGFKTRGNFDVKNFLRASWNFYASYVICWFWWWWQRTFSFAEKKVKITRILMNCIIVPFAILASQNPITLKRNSKQIWLSQQEIFSKFPTHTLCPPFPIFIDDNQARVRIGGTRRPQKGKNSLAKGSAWKMYGENLYFHEQQFRWNFHFYSRWLCIFWGAPTSTTVLLQKTWHDTNKSFFSNRNSSSEK